MPIFPVDGGRPLATRAMRPADATYGATVVDEHLGALLGEHLLPVRTRHGADDEPYLLAVDVHGRPVVVEVVGTLDGATLLRALVYLGRAARLSLRDLGALYRGGTQRFSADLATFRESVPATHLVAAGGGARLLLVCAQVGDGMADVVGGLADRGIEVLQVGLVDGPEGRLVDVSPVHLAAPDGSWSVSNGVASLSTRNGVAEPGIGEPPDEDTLARPPLPRPGMVTRIPTGIRPATGVPAPDPVETTSPGLPVPAWSAVRAEAADGAPEQPFLDGADPSPVPPPASAPPQPPQPPPPAPPAPEPAPAAPQQVAPAASPAPSAAQAPAIEALPVANPGTSREALPVRRPTPGGRTPHPVTSGVPVVAGDGRLSRLAAAGPVILVWHRRRRGEYHEALVHPDGLIELDDGTRVIDPSAAAEIASGSQVPVDGWRVWRVGFEDGLTLAEACGL